MQFSQSTGISSGVAKPPTRHVQDIYRQIECLLRVKALSGRLEPGRERHFSDALAEARVMAAQEGASACAAAACALDLLSLELCDD